MPRRLTVSLGVFLLKLVSIHVVSGQDVRSDTITTMPWIPKDYPDPDLDARACRTVHNRLCDPDSILADADIRVIENYLQQDRPFHPTCELPETNDSIQVQLAVALVKKMELDHFRAPTNQIMKASELFARSIHDAWGVGMKSPCGGSGVLLFLSDLDRSIYVSRGKALESLLTNGRIDQLVANMKPHLQNQEYGKAILGALQDIDSYIRQGEPTASEKAGELLVTYGGLGTFGLIFALAMWKARQQERQRRQYTQVTSHLNELDQQRAEALQGKFNSKSCPICLENFKRSSSNIKVGSDGLPVKLLRCGHAFDESCWSDWVKSGQGQYDKCPICRESVESSSPEREKQQQQEALEELTSTEATTTTASAVRQRPLNPSAPHVELSLFGSPHQLERARSMDEQRAMRLFMRERNFRLERLGARYPHFVRSDLIHRWSSFNYTGPLVQEPAFVKMNPQRQPELLHNQTSEIRSRGSGFGGARSSSGHGGRW